MLSWELTVVLKLEHHCVLLRENVICKMRKVIGNVCRLKIVNGFAKKVINSINVFRGTEDLVQTIESSV